MQNELHQQHSKRVSASHRQDTLPRIQEQRTPAMASRAAGHTTRSASSSDGRACERTQSAPAGSEFPLVELAREYLAARSAQERDHTDAALDFERTEAHDRFLFALDVAGVQYQDRQHGTQIALAMERIARAARAWARLDKARRKSMPYNGTSADHRHLCEQATRAWRVYVGELEAARVQVADRRRLALELAGMVPETNTVKKPGL